MRTSMHVVRTHSDGINIPILCKQGALYCINIHIPVFPPPSLFLPSSPLSSGLLLLCTGRHTSECGKGTGPHHHNRILHLSHLRHQQESGRTSAGIQPLPLPATPAPSFPALQPRGSRGGSPTDAGAPTYSLTAGVTK